MVYTIPVYSEQELTPRAMEVIRAIVDQGFPDLDIKFRPARVVEGKVLVFGKAPAQASGMEICYTYSIAQLMSKANAASVLIAGIQQMINVHGTIPFDRPLGFESVALAIDMLDPAKPTAIDIETSGNLGKTHTPEDVEIISVAFYQEGCPPIVIHGPASADVNCRTYPLLLSQKQMLADFLPKFERGIYHNGKFDIRVLNRVLGVKLVNWFDTMLAHHVLNHAAGDHKLKTAARRYLGAWDWETGLGQYTVGGGHYERIPADVLTRYNGWDVYWTYKLFEFLLPQIEADEDNFKAFSLEMSAAEFLLDVEKYGIPFDKAYATEYSEKLSLDMKWELLTLIALTGSNTFNPNSPKQVKDWIVSRGFPVKGTDVNVIAELKADAEKRGNGTVVSFCDALISYRQASKIKGTYSDGWSKKERAGRVHATYLVHGTSTGRLSSTGPNAQNVPRAKEIRKLVRVLRASNAETISNNEGG